MFLSSGGSRAIALGLLLSIGGMTGAVAESAERPPRMWLHRSPGQLLEAGRWF